MMEHTTKEIMTMNRNVAFSRNPHGHTPKMLSDFSATFRGRKGQPVSMCTRAYERNIDHTPPAWTQLMSKNALKARLRAKLAKKKKEEGSS